jgi:hypothetical protein
MRRTRPFRPRLAISAAVACLLLLAACEDPSGVGLTVIDPTASDPNARTIPVDSAALRDSEELTGAFLTDPGFENFQGLAGRVEDPVFGTTTAFGYFDVLGPQSFPEGFRDRPIEEATLRLTRTYTYGDTLGTTRLDVRQIAEEWTAAGAVADTLFPVQDDIVTSFDVAPGDSLIEVDLPESWIAANDTTLRSEEFSALFHGFRLDPSDEASAVYGFAGSSSLQLISEGDTVIYRVSEVFSNIEGPEEDATSDDLWRLQDGTGRGLELQFDLDALAQAAINTVRIRVNADTSAAAVDLPSGFVRPFARQLTLFGFLEDGDPVPITVADLDEDTQTFEFRSGVLTDIFQELVLDRSEVEGFVLGFPATPSSLDVMPLVRRSEPGCADDEAMTCEGPRAVVILIPSDV